MRISFVAGFGPIVPDVDASHAFYSGALGIPFEGDPGYWHTDALDGVRAFALWPLKTAAQSTFGQNEWPADLPVPQSWLEFDVEDADAVTAAASELEEKGYRPLVPPKTEEWGQTVCRLLSPEGLLVGVTYTPWMHAPD
ncbi:MAG: VOC family protein [Chloroflexi bacterium]|nr:VOC family protein [Chloroflexota bacterium]